MPLAAIALPIYVLLLPFLMLLLLVPGIPVDDAWFLRVSFTFLSPFSTVLWFIIIHRLLTHGRSRYSHQFLIFAASALLVLVMLRLGVYSLA